MLAYDVIETKFGFLGVAFKNNSLDTVVYIVLPTLLKDEVSALIEKKCVRIVEKKYSSAAVFVDYYNGKEIDFSSIDYDEDFFNPTYFQKLVWEKCAQIPYASTVTYGDLAQALRTKAYRAIGNALSKNPLPILVPCHRVIGKNNKLTGFSASQGINLKKSMLGIENQSRGAVSDKSVLF